MAPGVRINGVWLYFHERVLRILIEFQSPFIILALFNLIYRCPQSFTGHDSVILI